MKKSFTICLMFALTLMTSNLLFGQSSNTQLVDHNRAFDRNGGITVNPDWAPFYHGVASGDPLEDRVIIWTRITPDTMNSGPIDVQWKVATDPELDDIVQEGTFTTDADRDFTVKVDVTGLDAGTTYYYGFTALSANSLTGKTKTTPTGNIVDHLKFGVVSCSNFQAGYFNGYRRLAERNDLDAIIHLGDYIYEYADSVYGDVELFGERPLDPAGEIVTLDEYRTRYSNYRLDTALARAHQQHPFIAIWDDHESANDAYVDGAENHDPMTQGDWETRKGVARQAYFEWLPIRDNAEEDIFRTLKYGDLMDLILLDTRLEGREVQINDITDPALYDLDRTILGADQYNWFLNELDQSTAKWKVVAQQVIFSEFNVGWFALLDPTGSFEVYESLFLDIWDGYPAERSKIINYIDANDIDNVVILTGDFHSTFAYDVTEIPADLQVVPTPLGDLPVYFPSQTYDPATGSGSVAVEFATPSVTSANFDENLDPVTSAIVENFINSVIPVNDTVNIGNPNPHMKYTDLDQHGYYILDIKSDTAQANWYFTEIGQVVDAETFGEAHFTLDGENHLNPAAGESAPKAVQDIPAPLNPPAFVSSLNNPSKSRDFAVLSVYPNPFSSVNTLNYVINKSANVRIGLYDTNGRLVKQLFEQNLPKGSYTLVTSSEGLENGIYVYKIEVGNQVDYQKVVVKK